MADTRRSAAAQFFTEEGDPDAGPSVGSVYDKVVDLLNQASLMSKDAQKVGNLKQVQELIIHKDSNLLDNFFDEMIAFQSDRSVDVRKYVVGFMEEACKKDPELLTKIMPCLQHLLNDENVNVQKRVILTLSSIYKTLIMWLAKSKHPTPEMTQVWDIMAMMKKSLYDMLDSENDGIRTHAVKFSEGIILTLSRKTSDSEVPKIRGENVTLDSIPESSKYLKVHKLEEEGKKMFDALLQFQASPHISSINLMTVMSSLCNIAKQRPAFFGRVVQAFETLHVNLPPTLAKSQVSSVRKNLKMQMLSLLKHKCAVDYLPNITTLLTDLGATQSEVLKVMPKIDESKKRKRQEAESSTKKIRIERDDDDDDDIGMTPWTDRATDQKLANVNLRQTAIDITADDLAPRLNANNVADLVLISMVMLPDTMPAHFQATYTPIAAAGTDGQVSHMARLLATQLTMAGMGKGVAEVQREAAEKKTSPFDGSETPAFQGTSPKQLISTVVGGQSATSKLDIINKAMLPPPPLFPSKRVVKHFKLSAVTRPLEENESEELSLMALDRVLASEKKATMGNALHARTKILSCLVTQFGGEFKDIIQNYIFSDLRNRIELAFAWLYQEYANCMNFMSTSVEGNKHNMSSYDECLTRILNSLIEVVDQKEMLFHRVLLEAPAVTDNALYILRRFCVDDTRVESGLETLKKLIMTRPAHRLRFLDVLLEFTSSDHTELRNQAITYTKNLYETQQAHHAIEYYAVQMLKYLLLPKPSPELYAKLRGRQEAPETWNDDAIKMSLYLYLGLLPCNHKLIHELATVYTSTNADIKRTILRMLEAPVKGMGMDSPELLLFVENCPKGAETLVTRVIHILTDKAAPSPELVERVRDLYHKRVPDVRFLIPVLIGLNKDEVVAALPKLIKLNPVVVKEVFNRLLGGHGDVAYQSPLTPAELLIALHNLDDKVDMKTTIKATNLCFGEKKIYTQEVLALVMQNLMERSPLPTLFMRTVLQALSMYPRLLGLVLNILQRLILKQVWKQKKVWEGFVRCCQRTKPQSFQVLLQLPADQLKDVFQICQELQEPLLNHVNKLTDTQRSHLSPAIIQVLETDPMIEKREAEARAAQEAKEERLRKEAEEMMRIRREAEARAAQKDREIADKSENDRRKDKRRDERARSRERSRSRERERPSKENRVPAKTDVVDPSEPVFIKHGGAGDPSEPPRDRRESRGERRESRDTRMAALNPEPGDSVDLSDLPPVPRRRNTDILRNPSPQLRNPSPGHRNPSPHGEAMDVDITAVKSEPEDKGYERSRGKT
ncbi:symplekin-like isoform X2 [Ruditapes philippinarum]|uniref:symplekin-like isoform X2 n=1 Tax=Ruditapes philippinarum TaxID=129788 RepID=UPI00295B7691|nr:symplekin-like isoform X2 [Ruditapes philippinarum]